MLRSCSHLSRMMLWKVLVALCLLCLSDLAYGDANRQLTRHSRRKSEDRNGKAKVEEAVTKSTPLKVITENQMQSVKAGPVTEILLEKKKNKTNNQTQKLDKKPSTRSSPGDSWREENVFLYLYTRNQQVQVVTANSWFKNIESDKDLVIMVHGAFYNSNYIEDYFNTLAYALLNETNYNVIGVNWQHLMVSKAKKDHLESNIFTLKYLGTMLGTIFKNHFPKFFTNNLNTYFIGHDIGTIPSISFQETLKKSFRYVYGLNPRYDLPQSSYRLAQEHGEAVTILSTYNHPYSYGHKNIYAVTLKGQSSSSYKVLAKAISSGKTKATFCPDAEYFSNGYCSMLPHVPVWLTHSPATEVDSKSYPVGRYYFYDSLSINEKCCQ